MRAGPGAVVKLAFDLRLQDMLFEVLKEMVLV